ncbi:MAG: hypothetical protein HY292_11250 [Planctomycetes bacterium]|nr:hypothetical protein [Planctomycetota bacterium]
MLIDRTRGALTNRNSRFVMFGSRLAIAMMSLPVLVGGVPAGAQSIRPVALTGTDGPLGPSLGPGVVFVSFGASGFPLGSPSLSDSGAVAFLATIAGTTIDATNDEGVWSTRAGRLRAVTRKGALAPGCGADVRFSGWASEPMIGDGDQVAFQAIVAGPGVDNTNNDGLWMEVSGALALLIREGVTSVPESNPPSVFGEYGNPNSPSPTIWGNNGFVLSATGRVYPRSPARRRELRSRCGAGGASRSRATGRCEASSRMRPRVTRAATR